MLTRQKYGFIFLTGALLFALTSCRPKEGLGKKNAFAEPDTIMAPEAIIAGAPEIIALDTRPKPEVILVSLKPAAVKTPADFFVTMQNFNTEQGLALSSIFCGYKDKAGNLWFGTSGNGVSRYNGKSFTNYTSAHGLIHNLINCIFEDSKGNIWFGTYGGVSKYDGVRFENFTKAQGLVDNNVYSIIEDRTGAIWIGTANGASKYNPAQVDTGSRLFINYTKKEGLPGERVSAMLENKEGNLWFATSRGLCVFNPGKADADHKNFFPYPTNEEKMEEDFYNIFEDSKGNIWLGSAAGLTKFYPSKHGTGKKEIVHFTTANGLADNDVKCCLEDKEGNIWIGTNGGVSEYRIADSSFLNITMQQGLCNNSVYSVTEDAAGSIWFGTLGGGVCRYDGKAVVSFSTKQGLPGKAVFAAAEDKTGHLWFGSDEGGITQCDLSAGVKKGTSFVNFTASQGLNDRSPNSLLVDKNNNLWIGAVNGLSKYDGRSFTNYTSRQGLINDYVVSLTEDKKGNLWIGTYEGGVSKFDGRTFSNYTTEQGLVHKCVWGVLEDKKGIIWFATRGGLSRFDGKGFINFTKEQGLPDDKLSSVIEDKMGNLLIGSWGGGVSIMRKKVVDKLSDPQTLPKGEPIFENFSTEDGLSNDVVYNILEDSTGNIIIGTNVGLTVLKGGVDPSGKNISKAGIENYNQKTGYPIKDVSNNCSMLVDSRGIIWAGTQGQLIRFDYNGVNQHSAPSKTVIQSVKINNENISWRSLDWARRKAAEASLKSGVVPPYLTDEQTVFGRKLRAGERDTMANRFSGVSFDRIRRFEAIPENLTLPYSNNHISFDYAVIETARPFLAQYQYKLDGYDKNWSPLTDKTSAAFGNIHPGSYTFRLKALNPHGVWSETSYSFSVAPPWWRTFWAYALYLLAFIGTVFGFNAYRSAALRTKNQVLEEKIGLRTRQLEQKSTELEKSLITLKAAQNQLIQSEKLASLGELTAGIAHEIQNPLNFVNNFAEVSAEMAQELKEEIEKTNLPADARENINALAEDLILNQQKINFHGKRADSIVKGMLQHSRSAAGKKEWTDVNNLVDEYLRLSYHGLRGKDKSFNAALETRLDKSLPAVNMVAQDVGRVLVNIFTNAFYSMSKKKKETSGDYQPTLWVVTEKKGNFAEIRIKDNGAGIPQNVVDKIFNPFFTTKPTGEGTGLGLSLSYEIIVKEHGGALDVETKEGEFAEFIIRLPV